MNAKAVHARADADLHVVGVGALRVLLCEQRGEWFAQGIEVASSPHSFGRTPP